MGANITGWEPEKRTHFDEIVLDYDKIRPEYPGKLFEDILDFIGPGKKNALEIGAGTGKATMPFLEAGYKITAVEIGANMAEFLREKFKKYTDFNVIVAAFEDAVLDANSYDLVYAASSFHWVNAEVGCPKAFGILKSGGVFALMRYNFLATRDEALKDAIHKIYEKYYFSYYTSNPRAVRYKRTHEEFRNPSEISGNYGFADMKNYGFSDVSLKLYDVTRKLDADEYIKLLDTFADHRGLPEENRAALYAEIKEIILKRGGYIEEDDVFQLYMGRKPYI